MAAENSGERLVRTGRSGVDVAAWLRRSLKERQDWWLLALVLLLAFALRVYRLPSLPPGLNADEVFNVIDARRIGPGSWPVYIAGNNGREAFFFYLLAFSLRILGTTLWGLRLPAALLGTATAGLAFLIGRDFFRTRVGLLAGLLTAVSLWALLPSRVGLRAISLTFMTALTVYLLWRGLARGRWYGWVGGGLALGLTLYTYIPARIFPLVIAGWLLWVAVRRRDQLRAQRKGLLASLLLAFLVFVPYGAYIVTNRAEVNERIYSMETALDRARAGEPEVLLDTIGQAVGLFGLVGDEEWRYFIAGRPVLEPVTAIFFWLGAGVALWRALRRQTRDRRQPEYALLVGWWLALITPNMLLFNPSILRAAGAIVPAYLLVAVGLDTAYDWLRPRWPRPARLAPYLAGVGLFWIMVTSWQAYAVTWANHPEVRAIYHADQALMGRYLLEEAPPGTRVFVAASYVLDVVTPVSLAFYTDRPVSWFDETGVFPWPGTASTPALYLLPLTEQLPAAALSRLEAAARRQVVRFDDGDPAFLLFQVEDAASLGWEPRLEADVAFVDGPHLVGMELPAGSLTGTEIPVTLHWAVPPGQEALPTTFAYVQLYLHDVRGDRWSETERLLGYPQAGWQPGDRFVQQLALPVPAGMIPGPAQVQLFLRSHEGERYTTTRHVMPEEAPLLVQNRPLTDFVLTPEMLVFDETLALVGSRFSTELTPGLGLNLALDWIALRPPPADYRVQLQLAEPGAATPFLVQTEGIWPDLYPPSRWKQHEAVTTYHQFAIPLVVEMEADPELRVRLLPPAETGSEPLPVSQGDGTLAQMTWVRREHNFTPPPLARTVAARLGQYVRLLGYELDVSQARRGGQIILRLVWQALETPPDNYTVFTHLAAADGRLYGQFDGPPQGEAWLTRTWLPGEVVVEERVIPIDDETPPGSYRLLAGMYTAHNAVRLPLYLEGERQPDDALFLGTVTVE